MRLIDADALLDDMVDYVADGYADSRDDFEEYTKMVQTAPTIDAVEVVRGEWKHDGSVWTYRFNCTNCGYHLLGRQTNYCPNCGARMKGADDE